MIIEMDKCYSQISLDTKFAKKSNNPLDKRLDLMAYFLALIQTLRNNQIEFEVIKEICIEIATEYVKPKNRLEKWLKELPRKFINTSLANLLLKWMNKKVSTKGHENGFLARVITEKKETFGFGYGIDILECGVCKLFEKHNAGKYTPILCEVDKITSSLAGLELIRSGTIASGGNKCDFRFKKKLKTTDNV
jgi:hypothetical protein